MQKRQYYLLSNLGFLRLLHNRLKNEIANGNEITIFHPSKNKLLKDGSDDFEGQHFFEYFVGQGISFIPMASSPAKKSFYVGILSFLIELTFYGSRNFKQSSFYSSRVLLPKNTGKFSVFSIGVNLAIKFLKIIPGRATKLLNLNLLKLFKKVKVDLPQELTGIPDSSDVYFCQYLEKNSNQPLLANTLKHLKKTTNHVQVASWDNLTTKCQLKGDFDFVEVWAKFQKNEAQLFHNVNAKKIRVIGNDYWRYLHFPLDNKKVTIGSILYLCSSSSIVPNEEDVIVSLLKSLPAKKIKDFKFFIRGHPQKFIDKKKFSEFDNVVFLETSNSSTQKLNGQFEFYSDLKNYQAVIGNLTSSLVECAALGSNTFLYAPNLEMKPYHGSYLSGFIKEIKSLSDMSLNSRLNPTKIAAFFGIKYSIDFNASVKWRPMEGDNTAGTSDGVALGARENIDGLHYNPRLLNKRLARNGNSKYPYPDLLFVTQRFRQLRTEINNSDRQIAIGPFYAEVGYELAYWYPYIDALIKDIADKKRVTFFNRGGVSKLFFPECNHVDIISELGIEYLKELIENNSKNFSASLKQKEEHELDANLIGKFLEGDYISVHPEMMFEYYRRFYQEYVGRRFLDDIESVDFIGRARDFINEIKKPIRKPAEKIVALKLYDSSGLRLKTLNIEKLTNRIKEIGPNVKIKLFQTSKIDDHEQFHEIFNGFDLEKVFFEDSNNLYLQALEIASCDILITNYGGFSYFGPLLGIDTIALADDPHFWYSNAHFTRISSLIYLKGTNSKYSIEKI